MTGPQMTLLVAFGQIFVSDEVTFLLPPREGFYVSPKSGEIWRRWIAAPLFPPIFAHPLEIEVFVFVEIQDLFDWTRKMWRVDDAAAACRRDTRLNRPTVLCALGGKGLCLREEGVVL